MSFARLNVLLIGLLILGVLSTRERLDRFYSEDPRYFIFPPPPGLKYYSMGFSDTVADGLWLRFIQDIEKCKLTGFENEKKSTCRKGWGFQMLDQITQLSPRFRMPFATGPLSLSIISDDYEGASIIFDRATEAFPNDWPILYRAAYHFLYDRSDYKKAASLLMRAHANGGPHWLPLLASRLYSREGQLELGISTLKSYLETLKDDSEIKKTVNRRLASLECEKQNLDAGRAPTEACAKDARDFQ